MAERYDLNKGYNYMHARGVKEFPYYVGINSLAELATKEDRVCVINIMGGESSTVTPTSHVYSGGNVVCGTMPGRSGSVLKTSIGDIPVYNNILEAMEAGHRFNVVVIYVPPEGVRDAVIEAVRVNPELRKVVILTEKVKVRHARMIRAYCQMRGVDVFGANCLGLADAHNKVRIGGALGGSVPEESLVPGSVAIFSNSGNFTTTIATYLLTGGWGTTVSLSSGKDVYIHYGPAEFTYAMHNDDRSSSMIMYIEPGGYYEYDLEFRKPVVACIVGRWKAKLTRACGHAGAIAGAGDNAFSKEDWFKEKLGVSDLYTEENPICSAKGAVVTNIALIPQALTAVMKLNGKNPDFAPIGDLTPKCWFANEQGIELPKVLTPPVVEAMAPYNDQIAALSQQIGVVFPRQTLKDASGATRMDPKTQVTQIHNQSILDASTHPMEENLVMSLIREYPNDNGRAMTNVILNAFVNQSGSVGLAAADAAREAENSPNTSLSAAIAIVGPGRVKGARDVSRALVELFGHAGLADPEDVDFDFSSQVEQVATGSMKDIFVSEKECKRGNDMLEALKQRGTKSVFINFLRAVAKRTNGNLHGQAIQAAVCTHLAWTALMRKRLSLSTVYNLPWHFRIFSTLVGSAVSAKRQEDKKRFCGVDVSELMGSWSFGETSFLALMGHRPNEAELFAYSVLLGLIISNGPGTISGQGAKGAVSADGPEVPTRIQINKGYVGFLTHTGYAHGGNGYEAIQFLMERFRNSGLEDPGDPGHGLDLSGMAMEFAKGYKVYKTKAKAEGNLEYEMVPCINHPVFKGKDVNYDPREVYVDDLFKKRNDYNIFQDFYHHLVNALHKAGVSANVYCVNVDAVIAVLLLKMFWKPYRNGRVTEKTMEAAAFTTFLFGRMIGSAAEIDDHTNRGRNMDTRTAASKVMYVG